MTRITDEKKIFYKKMLLIGIPVVFQNFITMGLNLIDTLMIGMLGEQELAAVGAANQVYFIFMVSLFGLYSGAAVYTAQYWGAKDIDGVRKMLGIDYVVGFAFAVAVTVIAFIFAPHIISFFSKDGEVIKLGAQYIRIACFSYVFSGLSSAISYNARAIQNLTVPTAVSAVALCVNAVLNYGFIFGTMGFPELGVKGAAVATLIARICEFAALIIYIYTRKEHPFKIRLKNMFKFGKTRFIRVMKTAIPVVITECGWAVSVSLIFAAYGKLGTAALAVAQVANVILEMLQSFYFGVGNATAMIIGESLGQEDTERAFGYGKSSMKLVWALNIVITLTMILFSRPMASIYNFNGETNQLLIETLITMAILITPRMIAYIYIVGILRSGGDTMFCMKLDIAANFFIQVPMAYIAVLALNTSLPVAMALVEIGNIVRIILCVPRFRSRKWINIVT